MILPLFIHGKQRTSKIDCGDKIRKKTCLFTFPSRKMTMIASCLVATFVNFDTFPNFPWNVSALLRYATITSAKN